MSPRSVQPFIPTFTAAAIAKADELVKMCDESVYQLSRIVRDARGLLGVMSKWSKKSKVSILSKAKRAEIRAEKPWHDVEHVRDSLRFKARLEHLSVLPHLLLLFRRHNASIVKIDLDKLVCAKEFGWRPMAIDLRFPAGLLVEFYAVPWDLDERFVKHPNHLIFERWRGRSLAHRAANAKEYASDTFLSLRRYTNALWGWAKKQGMTSLTQLRHQAYSISGALSKCAETCRQTSTSVDQSSGGTTGGSTSSGSSSGSTEGSGSIISGSDSGSGSCSNDGSSNQLSSSSSPSSSCVDDNQTTTNINENINKYCFDVKDPKTCGHDVIRHLINPICL